jgi:hypothetical protein
VDHDDFGRPSVVRHRHADRLVTGYVGKDATGRQIARCQECGEQQLISAIEEPATER